MSEKKPNEPYLVGKTGPELFAPNVDDKEAQAVLLMKLAGDMAAPLSEAIMATREANPDLPIELLAGTVIEQLLAAGWTLSQFSFNGDRERAGKSYGALMRAFADKVERAGR